MATKEQRDQAWNNAQMIVGRNPNKWRRDSKGNEIYKSAYGKKGPKSWEVHHKKPSSSEEADSSQNLEAMQTAALRRIQNRNRADSHDDANTEIVLTLEDFANCGWETAWGTALESGERDNYYSMHKAFDAAADKALEEGREIHGKVLKRLSQVCSLKFILPTKFNCPFKPKIEVYHGGRYFRTTGLYDFSESDLNFFAQIVEAKATDNPQLNARLADIVWVMKPSAKHKHTFALAAIDNYRSIPLDSENWFYNEGGDCWRRSVELSCMLRTGAGNRLVEIRDSLFQALESAKTEDGSFAFFLADLLLSCPLENGQATMAGNRIARMGKEFETKPNYHLARKYFQKAICLFKKDGNKAKQVEMTAAIAEVWVKEADARISADESHAVAAMFYVNALQVYREIRGSEHAKQDVNKRIKEIGTLLNRSKEKSFDDMQTISVKADATSDVQYSRNAVSGKSQDEAMMAFATLSRVKVEEFRKRAIENIQSHPHLRLVPRNYLSSDGRLDARRPSINLDDIPPAVIDEQMLVEYDTYANLFVLGCILPALEVLHLEHRFNEAYFLNLAIQSPFVPMDRKRLFGRALAAGFNRDFEMAIHLLAPQIENIVRLFLKVNGARTTEIKRDGIESEKGLGALMAMPESKQPLGDDLHFEIRALFCERIGSNLRNRIAHGMINDAEIQSNSCAYAWWLALRLAFIHLPKELLEALLKDIDDSNLHDEADADDPVENEAE